LVSCKGIRQKELKCLVKSKTSFPCSDLGGKGKEHLEGLSLLVLKKGVKVLSVPKINKMRRLQSELMFIK
jgi:hypothetical protein